MLLSGLHDVTVWPINMRFPDRTPDLDQYVTIAVIRTKLPLRPVNRQSKCPSVADGGYHSVGARMQLGGFEASVT